ncbi:histone mono-ubiquitination 1 isoform X2 [Wolffia australiana]
MKRRHFSPVSPTVAEATAAKKNPLFPCSEERKLDTTVLQYQNQKLSQQLEVQKFEYSTLQNKFNQLKDDQKYYDETLNVVKKSWEQLTDELGSLSTKTRKTSSSFHVSKDEASSPTEDCVLSRLLETGANESSCASPSQSQLEDSVHKTQQVPSEILENIVAALNNLWTMNNQVTTALLGKQPDEGCIRLLHKSIHNSHDDVKKLRMVAANLQITHRSLSKDVQSHRDTSAKYMAENRRLSGELENTTAELKESKNELSVLKSQQDNGHGAPFLVATLGSNHMVVNGGRDRDIEYNELESAHKQMLELASARLLEIQSLHEKRKAMLVKLSDIQTVLNVKVDSSSKGLQVLHDQLGKQRAELDQFQSLLGKLQVEKDTFFWREKEVSLKIDMADICRRVSAVSECKIAELEKLLPKVVDEKAELEAKLREAFSEPGRKDIISQFKTLVSSLPKSIETMQSELTKHKEDASEVHSLKAKVESFTRILSRKESEMEILRQKSAEQVGEMKKLQLKAQDLKCWDQELKTFLEMFKRETSDSSDILEARDAECKAWARVQGLKSSLDEHKLELRVKAANEAEALSQQRLANAEAEIAELRQKLDSSTREILHLRDVLKSKCEEGEAYLSEIESIGQAYEYLQTQNQNLLQQITERDDYNIKLLLDGVKDRQIQEALQIEIRNMNSDLEQANISLDFYNLKAVRFEDQTRNLAEQVGKLVEDGCECSSDLENVKQRLSDASRDSLQLRRSVEDLTSKAEASRKEFTNLQISLEEERFKNNRIDEDIEVKIRKAAHLKARHQGPSLLEKLQHELKEYRGILKCGICKDRQKEVVIAKCYHLVCNPCVQKVLASRHRKCPVCGTSFGPNDIKPIYI